MKTTYNEKESQLKNKRIENSNFLLGISLAIVASIFVESFFRLFIPNKEASGIIFFASMFTLFIIYAKYRRINKHPDFLEYKIEFSKRKNLDWEDLLSTFANRTKRELENNKEYRGMKIKQRRFKFIDNLLHYKRFEIVSGVSIAYLYFHDKPEKMELIVDNTEEGDSVRKVVTSAFRYMKDNELINLNREIMYVSSFHASLLHPIKIKGKPVG